MNKRQILTSILSVLLSVFLVVGVVMATTTIGLDIANDSTTQATGISLTGTYSAAGLKMGTSGTPLTISTTAKAVDIYTTSGVTTGTVRSTAINQVQSVASAVTKIEALRVNVESEVQTGDWVNAIVGRIDYGDTGYAGGGMAAPICAELMLPNTNMTSLGGEYTVLDLEMGTGASTVFHENAAYPYSFIRMSTWGTTEMDDHGYLFNIDGIATATDGLFEVATITPSSVEFDACLKIRIGTTDYFIPLGSDKAFE